MNHKFYMNRKALTTAEAAVLIVVLLVVSVFAYVWMFGTPNFGGTNPGQWQPTAAPTYNPNQPTTYAGPLLLSTVDRITGTGFVTATTTVDQIAAVNGVFNFISGSSKSVAMSGTQPNSMLRVWNQGTQLVVMVDSTGAPTQTGGGGYYPAMYYMTLNPGAPIYEITSPAAFVQVSASPYTYSINTAACTMLPQTISEYQSSNVNYWNIGDLALTPRTLGTMTNLKQYLTYNGATLASVTDGTTWINTNTTVTANCTLTSVSNEKLTLQAMCANASLGWGQEYFVVGASGQINHYGAVFAFTTQMLNIGYDALANQGFQPLTLGNLYNEKGFYKVLSIANPAKGQNLGFSITIPVDATSAAAATAYRFYFWLDDCQNLGTVGSVGPGTSAPSAYGFVTSYGVTTVVPTLGMTTSGGYGATPQLMTWVTTHS